MQGAARRPQSSVGKRRNAADAPSCATLREGLAWPHGGVGRQQPNGAPPALPCTQASSFAAVA